MVSKATKNKISKFWQHKCAVCMNNDYLEFHHLIPKIAGGSDDIDNIILLCGRCHATIHGRTFNPKHPNCKTTIDYESAIPILQLYFSNQIGTRETKELLHLSQKHTSRKAAFINATRENII